MCGPRSSLAHSIALPGICSHGNGGMKSGAKTAPFGSWRVPVADDVHAPLHEHLEGAVAYLDAALTSGGRVCAFCHDGRSTAPAVVAFYLMRRRQMSLAAALDAIYAVRPDAQPNVGFWQRLVEATPGLADARGTRPKRMNCDFC